MQTISIITVTLNSARYLEQTIQSVLGQTYPHIEFIIVDGGSVDGTLGIIEKYAARIDRWISEPDEGIADAMNRGLELASGDFVHFLHSDDYLESEDAIERTSRYLDDAHDVFLFSIYLDKHGVKTLRHPRGFTAWMNFKTGAYHQSAICRAALFERIGGFDESFRITMDYDFFLRAYRASAPALTVDLPLTTMRLVGLSSQDDWASLKARFAEERRAQSKNCRSAAMKAAYVLYWLLYLPYRRLRSYLPGP